MSTRIRKPGDGDGQGSVLLNAADEESEAPFAVREASITTSGLGSWAQKLTAQVPANRSTLAGIGLGVLFLLGIIGLGSVNGDDPGVALPNAGAAGASGPGGGGSRGQFSDGGLFSSEAPKKRSRAAGAAGKEAALAAATGDGARQSLDAGPAGPAIIGPADLDQLGRADAGRDVADDVNVGATTLGDSNGPGRAGAGRVLNGGRSTSSEVTTATIRGLDGPGGPVLANPTSRPTIPTGPPTTGSTPGSVTAGGQTTAKVPTTIATSAPSTSSRASTPTQAPLTQPVPTQPPPTSPETQPAPTQPAPTSPETQPAPTSPPATDPPIDNTPLVAAPGNGSAFARNARVTFAAHPVAGADQYCWTFSGAGVGAVTKCTSGTTYRLSLGDYPFQYGQVAVTSEAKRGTTTLKSGSVTINLVLDQVLVQPMSGESHVIGRAMRIGFRGVSGATRYCYRLRNSGHDSGDVCLSGNGTTIGPKDPLWDLLSPGDLEVTGRVWIGGTAIGSESVTITLTS